MKNGFGSSVVCLILAIDSALIILKCHYAKNLIPQANDYNLEISCDGIGEAAVDTMKLTLLNPQPAHAHFADYKAPSLLSVTSST